MADRCGITQIGWCSVHGVWCDRLDAQWLCPDRGKLTEFETGRLAGLREAAEVCRRAFGWYRAAYFHNVEVPVYHFIRANCAEVLHEAIRKLIEEADNG